MNTAAAAKPTLEPAAVPEPFREGPFEAQSANNREEGEG